MAYGRNHQDNEEREEDANHRSRDSPVLDVVDDSALGSSKADGRLALAGAGCVVEVCDISALCCGGEIRKGGWWRGPATFGSAHIGSHHVNNRSIRGIDCTRGAAIRASASGGRVPVTGAELITAIRVRGQKLEGHSENRQENARGDKEEDEQGQIAAVAAPERADQGLASLLRPKVSARRDSESESQKHDDGYRGSGECERHCVADDVEDHDEYRHAHDPTNLRGGIGIFHRLPTQQRGTL